MRKCEALAANPEVLQQIQHPTNGAYRSLKLRCNWRFEDNVPVRISTAAAVAAELGINHQTATDMLRIILQEKEPPEAPKRPGIKTGPKPGFKHKPVFHPPQYSIVSRTSRVNDRVASDIKSEMTELALWGSKMKNAVYQEIRRLRALAKAEFLEPSPWSKPESDDLDVLDVEDLTKSDDISAEPAVEEIE